MAYKAKLRRSKRRREEAAGIDPDEDVETEQQRLERIRSGYINKQHVLVFSSRGISYRYRHLMNDIRDLLPHSKKDVKFDCRNMNTINEVCDMKGCNNCMFFDSRKREDLYLWIGKTPDGPCVKFHVTNIHTMSELKFSGNCLKGSRPILQFDGNFDTEPHLQLIKELLSQAFNTPKMHPRSKPFTDHIINFYYSDGRIWFRNYQVTEEYKPELVGKFKTERVLVEIGPRFVLQPIKILSGSFYGAPLYENPDFVSPNVIRAYYKNRKSSSFMDRVISDRKRADRRPERRLDPTSLDMVFADEPQNDETQTETSERGRGRGNTEEDEDGEYDDDESDEGEDDE
eukprot:TRINITY_DN18534_c0_g1_i2.p1 TRINITY_DN18534_c0_g1~~TRINITY_DN18534_c0_g1_i2.p1  ORF type:complete len:343 (+),score=57.09 TRINITY_DN18534_c0_g1_i2:51-1079(+)